jgi:hypothetical protein
VAKDSIFRGWQVAERIERGIRRTFAEVGTAREAKRLDALAETIMAKLSERGLHEAKERQRLAQTIAGEVLSRFKADGDLATLPIFRPLASCILDVIDYEGLFALPEALTDTTPARSALWEAEDKLIATAKASTISIRP